MVRKVEIAQAVVEDMVEDAYANVGWVPDAYANVSNGPVAYVIVTVPAIVAKVPDAYV